MRYFLIKVNRVFLDHNPAVQEEWIRGDMVRNLRAWHKSEKDNEAVEGPMTQVTLYDYDAKLFRHIRLAEGTEEFAKRLYDHKRTSADRRPFTKPTS